MIAAGLDGLLEGGEGLSDTVVTITYQAQISENYIDSKSIDKSVDANDILTNEVSVTAQLPGG